MHKEKLFTYFVAQFENSGVFYFYFHESPLIAGFFVYMKLHK